ncbi:hypothetical protein HD806DRAFT_474188 [Xylariaceae sp. AK1471]|nr:hypothetical protein HD806DRAFT_474188 [Xylariaceae sp. AK1471]
MDTSKMAQTWPPVAIIGLLTLLVTIILAPVGWAVQRYLVSKEKPSSPASTNNEQNLVETGNMPYDHGNRFSAPTIIAVSS